MNKLYSVHDHWTDINKKNDVDIKSVDGVITGVKVNGEDYGGGGGSQFSTIFEGVVTTEYNQETETNTSVLEDIEILGDPIKVTFDGTEYICADQGGFYGAVPNDGGIDFSEYPFIIATNGAIATLNAGTYDLKIEESQSGGGGGGNYVTDSFTNYEVPTSLVAFQKTLTINSFTPTGSAGVKTITVFIQGFDSTTDKVALNGWKIRADSTSYENLYSLKSITQIGDTYTVDIYCTQEFIDGHAYIILDLYCTVFKRMDNNQTDITYLTEDGGGK